MDARKNESIVEVIQELISVCKSEKLLIQASDLEARLASIGAGNLHVHVIGRRGTGKSTLINALLGSDLLPIDVMPCTALPVEIVYGPTSELTVLTCTEEKKPPLEELANFVSQDKNPGNIRQVQKITVSEPIDMLKNITLIDTPGFQSIHASHDRASLNSLSKADLVLFLYRPPVLPPGEAEYDLLSEVFEKSPNIVLVQNENSGISDGNRILNSVLVPLASRRIGVRSQFRLDALNPNDPGLAELRSFITRTARGDGTRIATDALTNTARETAAELLSGLKLQLDVANSPIGDAGRKRERLQESTSNLRNIAIELRNAKAKYADEVEVQILGHLTSLHIYIEKQLDDLLKQGGSQQVFQDNLVPRTNAALKAWYHDLEQLVRHETERFQRNLVEAEREVTAIIHLFENVPSAAFQEDVSFEKSSVELNIKEIIKPDTADRVLKALFTFAEKAAKPLAALVGAVMAFFDMGLTASASAGVEQGIKVLGNLGVRYIERDSKAQAKVREAWNAEMESVSRELRPQLMDIPPRLTEQVERWISKYVDQRTALLQSALAENNKNETVAQSSARRAELERRNEQVTALIKQL